MKMPEEQKEFEKKRAARRLKARNEIKNIPEHLRMAARVYLAVEATRDHFDRLRGEVAAIIAEEEVDALGGSLEINETKTEIVKKELERIVKASRKAYEDALQIMDEDTQKEAIEQAVQEASQPGINQADRIVQIVLSKQKESTDFSDSLDTIVHTILEDKDTTASELAQRVTVENLIDIVAESLDQFTPEQLSNNDFQNIKTTIQELAKDSWMDDKDKAKVRNICDRNNDNDLEQSERVALAYVATAIHTSWEGIQDLRSIADAEQGQFERFDAVTKNFFEDMALSELIEEEAENKGLRIFRDAFRTFPAMERAIYERAMSDNKSTNEAIAAAVFELMKDVVQIDIDTE